MKLAETLIAENFLENALLELTTFKNHRLQKGWRLPESFDTLYKKVSHIDLKIKDNKQLFPRYIQTAENFAYQDIEWIDVVLTDRWISDDKKERVNFTNGVDLDFTTGINKFPCLKRVQTGETFKVKCHKQEIQKEIDNPNSWPPKKIITEHKIIPLLIERTEKENWSILPQKYGYIEYVNKDKKTLHVITNDSNPIFYQFDQDVFTKGSYIVFRQYSKKIKDENRYFIEDIQNFLHRKEMQMLHELCFNVIKFECLCELPMFEVWKKSLEHVGLFLCNFFTSLCVLLHVSKSL